MIKQLATIILFIALITLGAELFALQLRDVSFLTGWILIILGGSIGLLFVIRHYHGNTNSSSQRFYHASHLILGWIMLYVFLLHSEFKLPDGLLEKNIFGLFVVICMSGICGLIVQYFNRRSAGWQSNHQISAEKLPLCRRELREEAEEVVLVATQCHGNTQLSEYYNHNLLDYFNSIPRLLPTLFGQRRAFANMLKKIQQLTKTLPDHQDSLDKLRELIHKKSAIEYQHAWQSFLSGWQIIHKYLSYSLVALVLLHVILVYVFAG